MQMASNMRPMANAYQQYKEQSLSTMSQGELLIKLFDELTKQLNLAKIYIEKSDLSGANTCLTKSQTIVATLADSLDMRYPISKELREMYIFWANQLMTANMKKDISIIDGILPLIKDLRETFEQAHKLSRTGAKPAPGSLA